MLYTSAFTGLSLGGVVLAQSGRYRRNIRGVMVYTIVASIAPMGTVAAQDNGGEQREVSAVDSDTLAPVPLFGSADLLMLRLEVPLKQVFKEREQESSYHPAVLSYVDASGDAVRLDVQVKTRGKSRLLRQVCNFPPIRINFKKKQVENTVFAGQDKLKLVTHCQSKRRQYEQFVLQEFLLYQTYNLITDLSYRVRLARMTYVDAEEGDSLTKFAFFIEDEDAMAERSGWEAVKAPLIQPEYVDGGQLAIFEVFHFMIGSTDWSAFFPEPDKDHCCHNSTPVGTTVGPVFPVPYDLDMTGVVNPPYGKPSEKTGLFSLRQRRFWGTCKPRPELDAALAKFNEQREAITALHRDQADLEERYVKRTLEYFDDFYKIISDSSNVTKRMERDCRDLSRAVR